MQTTNKTLSPWVLSDNVNDTEGEPFKEFCIEDGKGDIVGFFTDENQARLIAAAPELLAALQELIFQMDEKPDPIYYAPAERMKRLNDFLPKARQAIAKAKGE